MQISEYFGASKILIVAGKGGVGKTTVGASLALAAGRAGLDVLIVELDGRPRLASAFSASPLSYDETVLWANPDGQPGQVRGRRITPDEALLEYLRDKNLDKIAARLLRTGALDVVSTATPGIEDLLLLGKIGHLEREDPADLIIVDAPAAGHAITFLKSAAGVGDALSGVGPLQEQSETVGAMLSDETRTRVLLVTLPEETPVNEIIETAFNLEDEVEVALAPIVVNAVWSPIEGLTAQDEASQFRLIKSERQSNEIERLKTELPLSQIQLPFLFTTEIGMESLSELADELAVQIEALP